MKKITISIFIILTTAFSFNVLSQNTKKPQSKSTKTPKVISLGVVNGRALNLVKPDFPDAALEINLSGPVTVEILVDAAGYVLEAKALDGHKILQKPSVEAALNSKFAPLFINNKQTRFKGTIRYDFLPRRLNWLEIGYFSPETERIKRFLPEDFIEEKEIITKMNSTETPYDPDGHKKLFSSIENKLQNDGKSLWLFKLGITLRKLIDNPWDQEPKVNLVTEIQTMLYSKPENVSPNLIKKLENIVRLNQENPKLIMEEFVTIFDKFYILGK